MGFSEATSVLHFFCLSAPVARAKLHPIPLPPYITFISCIIIIPVPILMYISIIITTSIQSLTNFFFNHTVDSYARTNGSKKIVKKNSEIFKGLGMTEKVKKQVERQEKVIDHHS